MYSLIFITITGSKKIFTMSNRLRTQRSNTMCNTDHLYRLTFFMPARRERNTSLSFTWEKERKKQNYLTNISTPVSSMLRLIPFHDWRRLKICLEDMPNFSIDLEDAIGTSKNSFSFPFPMLPITFVPVSIVSLESVWDCRQPMLKQVFRSSEKTEKSVLQ